MKYFKVKKLKIGNIIRWDLNDYMDEFQPEQGYIDGPLELWQLGRPERISGIPLSDSQTISKLLNYRELHIKQNQIYEDNSNKYSVLLQVGSKQFQFKTIELIDYFHQLQNIYLEITGEELINKC